MPSSLAVIIPLVVVVSMVVVSVFVIVSVVVIVSIVVVSSVKWLISDVPFCLFLDLAQLILPLLVC